MMFQWRWDGRDHWFWASRQTPSEQEGSERLTGNLRRSFLISSFSFEVQ
jgi:hypothetical protein